MSPQDPSRSGGTDRPLTDLEACVLGVVHGRQPCTAYAVRAEFAASPTRRWSGSAGAIYPLVRRLHAAELLSGEQRPRGSRTSILYRLTEAGVVALRGWLRADDLVETISLPVDPVRTRLHFVGALPEDDRRRWGDAVVEGLRAQVEALREEWRLDAFPTDLDRWIARGALDLAEARLTWFEEVRRRLGDSSALAGGRGSD